MKYLTLYRKYRPNKFSEIIGQDQIILSLRNAIMNKKFSHAYLFCGPRGIGKTSTAKIFAKTINCLNINNGESCDECDICISFNKGQAMDFFEIDGASNNGIDEIRELKEKISLLPTQCQYKVYIIDEVHMLTINAFNALLKTLEEPPKHAVFILATTEVYKIPMTIISRCQKFDFKRTNKKDLVSNLQSILNSEMIPFEDDALEQIAILSDGAIRDSLSILEQVIAYNQTKITLDNVNDLFAIPSKKETISFICSIIKNENLKVIQQNDQFFYKGVDLNTLTVSLINICKDVLIFKATSNENLLLILDYDDIVIFDDINEKQLLLIIDNYLDALNNYRFSNNAKMYFEVATFKTINHFAVNQTQNVQKKYQSEDEKKVTEKLIIPKKQVLNQENVQITANTSEIISENNDNEDNNIQEDNIQIINKPFIWELHDYFNILMQADKYVRVEYSKKWEMINQNLSHQTYHKVAKMLLDTTIIAATRRSFILSCPSVKQAILINNYSFTKNMQNFLEKILEDEKIVIMAVHQDEISHIRQEFYQLRIANKLPETKAIKFEDYYSQEEDIDAKESILNSSTYQAVQELFDDIILIE